MKIIVFILACLMTACANVSPDEQPTGSDQDELKQLFPKDLSISFYLLNKDKKLTANHELRQKAPLQNAVMTDTKLLKESVIEVLDGTFDQWQSFSATTQQQLIIKVTGLGLKSNQRSNYVTVVRVQLLEGNGQVMAESIVRDVLIHDQFDDDKALKSLFKTTFINALVAAAKKSGTAINSDLALAQADFKPKKDANKSGIGQISGGSGFYINKKGDIVTNNHVIAQCISLTIVDYQGQTYPAEKVASSPEKDLAIIRSTPSKYYAFMNNKNLALGESVFTLGYPAQQIFSRGATLTSGVVSSLSGMSADGHMLQISVPIQPGNSGGPLISMNGKILGVVAATINSEKFYKTVGTLPQNINFAITHQALETFLREAKISFRYLDSNQNFSLKRLANFAKRYTVKVECNG